MGKTDFVKISIYSNQVDITPIGEHEFNTCQVLIEGEGWKSMDDGYVINTSSHIMEYLTNYKKRLRYEIAIIQGTIDTIDLEIAKMIK